MVFLSMKKFGITKQQKVVRLFSAGSNKRSWFWKGVKMHLSRNWSCMYFIEGKWTSVSPRTDALCSELPQYFGSKSLMSTIRRTYYVRTLLLCNAKKRLFLVLPECRSSNNTAPPGWRLDPSTPTLPRKEGRRRPWDNEVSQFWKLKRLRYVHTPSQM